MLLQGHQPNHQAMERILECSESRPVGFGNITRILQAFPAEYRLSVVFPFLVQVLVKHYRVLVVLLMPVEMRGHALRLHVEFVAEKQPRRFHRLAVGAQEIQAILLQLTRRQRFMVERIESDVPSSGGKQHKRLGSREQIGQ